MPYRDKKKQAESGHRWYLKNKKITKQRAHIFSKKQRTLLRRFILDLKKNSYCVDCGVRDFRILDFDHLPQFKKYKEISSMANDSVSLEKLKREISKCAIRCANCHRIITWERKFRRVEQK